MIPVVSGPPNKISDAPAGGCNGQGRNDNAHPRAAETATTPPRVVIEVGQRPFFLDTSIILGR